MSFTRQSIRPIEYKGVVIPADTPFFMVSHDQECRINERLLTPPYQNLWAANHDPTHFKSPMDFVPDRFVGVSEANAGGTQHFSYGAGTRNCAGNHLANRELYAIFTRLILAFNIRPTTNPSMRPELDTIECNSVPTSFVTQPKPFQVHLQPRDRPQLEKWLKESWDNTADIK